MSIATCTITGKAVILKELPRNVILDGQSVAIYRVWPEWGHGPLRTAHELADIREDMLERTALEARHAR